MDKIFKLIQNVFRHNERQVKEKNRIEMIRKYQVLYKTANGKAVLDDILAMTEYGGMVVGKTTEETYFNLGKQNVGVEIATILNADLTKLQEIENDERDKEEKTEI